MKHSSSAKLDK